MRCAAGPRPVGAPPATGLEDETLNDVAVPLGPQIKELLREGGASERASVLGGATLAGFIASAFRCARAASKTLHSNPCLDAHACWRAPAPDVLRSMCDFLCGACAAQPVGDWCSAAVWAPPRQLAVLGRKCIGGCSSRLWQRPQTLWRKASRRGDPHGTCPQHGPDDCTSCRAACRSTS